MLKIKDNVDLKELEKYGFTTSKKVKDKYNFAYKTIADKIEKQDEEIRQIKAYIESKKKKSKGE